MFSYTINNSKNKKNYNYPSLRPSFKPTSINIHKSNLYLEEYTHTSTIPTTTPITNPTTTPITNPTIILVSNPTTMPITNPTTMPITNPTTMPITNPTIILVSNSF